MASSDICGSDASASELSMAMGNQEEDDDDGEIGEASERSAETAEGAQQILLNTAEQHLSRKRTRQYCTYVVLSSYKVIVRPNGKKLAPGLVGMHSLNTGTNQSSIVYQSSIPSKFVSRIELKPTTWFSTHFSNTSTSASPLIWSK